MTKLTLIDWDLFPGELPTHCIYCSAVADGYILSDYLKENPKPDEVKSQFTCRGICYSHSFGCRDHHTATGYISFDSAFHIKCLNALKTHTRSVDLKNTLIYNRDSI
jgi:hypothetical protein